MSSSVSVSRNQIIEYLASLSESDRGKVIQEIESNGRKRDELVEKGKRILNLSCTKVCYLDPTYDKTFKWLVRQSGTECNFMRTFFDTTLFLAYKNLFERKVDKFEPQSGEFDAMTEQLNKLPERLSLFKALLMDVSGKLVFAEQKISKTTNKATGKENGSLESASDTHLQDFAKSVFAKVEDALNSEKSRDAVVSELQEELTSFIHNHVDQEADISIKNVTGILNREPGDMLVDIEFQRSKQTYINVRVLQYGGILLLSQNATNSSPTLLVSICRWNSDQVVRDVFHAALGENAEKGPTTSQVAINIGKAFDPVGKSKEEVESERKRIEEIIEKGLRIRFPELVEGVEKFEDLWTDKKELESILGNIQEGLDRISNDLQTLIEARQGSKEDVEGAQQESRISINAQQDLEENLRKGWKLSEAAEHERLKEIGRRLKELEKSWGELRLMISKNKLRTAYELLCFLSLAPLTPDLDEGNFGSGNTPKVFNETIKKAYEMVRIENNVENRPDVNEWYVGVANAREEAKSAQQKNFDNLVKTALSFIKWKNGPEQVEDWARNVFSDSMNRGIRGRLIKELKDREVEKGEEKQKDTVLGILEKEYESVDQGLTTPKRAQSENAI